MNVDGWLQLVAAVGLMFLMAHDHRLSRVDDRLMVSWRKRRQLFTALLAASLTVNGILILTGRSWPSFWLPFWLFAISALGMLVASLAIHAAGGARKHTSSADA
jgi:hypothetical protein